MTNRGTWHWTIVAEILSEQNTWAEGGGNVCRENKKGETVAKQFLLCCPFSTIHFYIKPGLFLKFLSTIVIWDYDNMCLCF
jgi:hypothetical protein